MRSEEEIKEALNIQEKNAMLATQQMNTTTGSVKEMFTRRFREHREKITLLKWVLDEGNTNG